MRKLSPKLSLGLALTASFLVYLFPLVLPHGSILFGQALFVEIFSHYAGRETLWIAADISLALMIQAAFFLVCYRVFRRPGLIRIIIAFLAVPVLTVVLVFGYLIVMPTYFLIERDTHVERGDWKVACDIENASLSTLRFQNDLTFEKEAATWITMSPGLRMSLLKMPGCRVSDLGAKFSTYKQQYVWVLPNGGYLYRDRNSGEVVGNLFFVPEPGAEALSVRETQNGTGRPVLSPNGKWIGRLVREVDAVKFPTFKIILRRLIGEERIVISLTGLKRGSFELLGIDMEQKTIRVVRNMEEYLWLNTLGSVEREVMRPGGLNTLGQDFLPLENGWVAWDGYIEKKPYRIAWSVQGVEGSYRVPKGSRIVDVSVSPDGRFVAVSVSTALSIGNTPDSVFVVKTSNGEEVFRKYLPRYTRSMVTFLGNGYFAYSEVEGTKGSVKVLEITE